jgi:WD40 repeat protein
MPAAPGDQQLPSPQEVFISYSRKDADFVRRLDEALKSRGREAWVDWEDIRPTEEWMQAIYAAIEGANTFIFVLTPDSVASAVCGREIAHAAAHNKRMVPIVARDVTADGVPEALAKLNWIFFRESDDFEKATDTLISALDTDLKWIHAHTRLLTRAIEWNTNGKNNSFVLRGDDLRSAEQWLAQAGISKERQPTVLQTEYIIASRKAETRRQRTIRTWVSVAALIAVILASWATIAAKRAAAQKRETQRLLVVSDANRAEELFSKGESAGAIAFLARAVEQDPEKYSAVADRLWFALTERSWPLPLSAPMRHDDRVLSASFDGTGQRIVTASQDHTARIWDAKSGTPLTAPLRHPGWVRRGLFTPDGSHVLTICFDGIARLWDATSGQLMPHWQVEHPREINSVAFSPSGKWVATGSADGLVRVSDLVTGTLVREVRQDENVHTLCFHPTDDTLLLTVSGKVAKLWRLPAGEPLLEMPHEGDINSAQFTPAGERIVTASSDRTVRIWDMASRSSIAQPIAVDDEVLNAVVSPTGELIATITGRRLQVWEMAVPRAPKYTFDYNQQVTYTTFSPDGLVLFNGMDDGTVASYNMLTGDPAGEAIREDGAIVAIEPSRSGDQLLIATANGITRVWQSPPRFPISDRFAQTGPVESLNVSRNDRFLLTGSGDGNAYLWDLENPIAPAKQFVHGVAVTCTAFSHDAKYVLTGADVEVRLWLAASGVLVGRPLVHTSTVVRVLFSPNSNLFATATEDGTAQFWDTATRRAVGKAMRHQARLTSIDFTHDGKRFLTAGSDGKLRIWFSGTGEPDGPPLLVTKEITSARFSPKSDLVAAGSSDGSITIWSLAALDKPLQPFVEKDAISDLAFSPDERFLAAASEDHTAAIWNVSTCRPVGDLLTQAAAISKVVFSSDSTKIATASEDGVVQVWDAATGRALTEPLRHQEAVRCLAFSQDGRRLFSGARDGVVKAWDVASNLAPSDRIWLVKFARSIVPARLNAAGRIEFQTVATRESLCSQGAPSSAATRALFNWFFAPTARRPLTPYNKTTLADYLRKENHESSALSLAEQRFFAVGSTR